MKHNFTWINCLNVTFWECDMWRWCLHQSNEDQVSQNKYKINLYSSHFHCGWDHAGKVTPDNSHIFDQRDTEALTTQSLQSILKFPEYQYQFLDKNSSVHLNLDDTFQLIMFHNSSDPLCHSSHCLQHLNTLIWSECCLEHDCMQWRAEPALLNQYYQNISIAPSTRLFSRHCTVNNHLTMSWVSTRLSGW